MTHGVDISVTVFLFVFCNSVCVFVRLRISAPRIKLAASNFARWFIGVLGRESHILGNLAFPEAPPEAPNRTNRPARGPHVLGRALADSSSALTTCRSCMCGYTSVPEDGRTCFFVIILCVFLRLRISAP